MKLNPDNDIYQGDLTTLNANKQAWSRGETGSSRFRIASWIVLGIGFIFIVIAMLKTRGGETTLSQLPLHLSIWATAIAAILVSRQGKRRSEKPFAGFHMAHFEADDDTVYYQFQKGMTLQTYYIKDENIKKIYRDDKAGVLLIEGDATVNVQTRKDESEHSVSEFYALVPFDKYDLDDLLAPYKKKVKKADGQLREKYTSENM
jgi:hypothetical protein